MKIVSTEEKGAQSASELRRIELIWGAAFVVFGLFFLIMLVYAISEFFSIMQVGGLSSAIEWEMGLLPLLALFGIIAVTSCKKFADARKARESL